jgi:hypothetical protein
MLISMKTLLKSIYTRRRALLLTFALLPLFGRNASAQLLTINNYATLNTALANQSSGSIVLTNFLLNSVISVETLAQTLQITGDVTIDGTGNNIIIDGGGSNQLFNVHTNARLVLNNLQLLHGRGTNGGAIFNAGALIISNCTIAGNAATNFPGVNGLNAFTNSFTNGTSASAGRPALGGAIFSLGPLSVYYTAFLTNQVLAGAGGNGGNGAGFIGAGNGTSGGAGGPGGDAFGGAVWSAGSNNVFFATEFIGNTCVAGPGGNGGAGGVVIGIVPGSGLNGNTGQGAGGGAAAGGGVYLTGALSMSNCLFYNNIAVAGASGAAELLANGTGNNGIDGPPAGGGGLYLSNSVPSAYIENTIFFANQCDGGNGGAAEGSSTTAGSGGPAEGGGIFTGAAILTIRNCTLATNLLNPGLAGSDAGTNGLSGTEGITNGWQIDKFDGVVEMANSILSGGPTANAIGVIDAGYNISSDASLAKATTYTRLNTDPGLDSGLSSDGGPLLGPPIAGSGLPYQTLALIAGSPASNAIPGIPGLSFPATDERLMPRGTPASIGAFEVHTIPTNAITAASITVEPTNELAITGKPAYFSVTAVPSVQDPNPLGYQWQLDGKNLTDDASFSGTRTPTLTVKDVSSADWGAYQVFVSPTILDSLTNSSVVYLLVNQPVSFTSQPASQLNEPVGAVVTFKVGVAGPPPFTFQWQSNGVPLVDGNEFSGSTTSNLTLNPVTYPDAAKYTVVVGNFHGSVTSAVARLTVVADNTKPTVTIASPAAGARATNTFISGTATDNAQVANVFVWVTNFFNGTTSYINTSAVLSTNNPRNKTWITVPNAFLPGSNTVAVQSVDYSGNLSPVAIRKFFYVVPSPFALSYDQNDGTVTGSASVPGNVAPTNGADLTLGESYTLVAHPGPNYLLTNWTSSTGMVSNAATLHFIMTDGLSIQANFVPSPFIPVAGVYNGLFFQTNDTGPTEQTAGMISQLTLRNLGAYSGTLLLGGLGYSLSGAFDIFGHASNYIARAASRGGPVSVVMTVEWTNSQITGYVSGTDEGGWTSPLNAEEANGTGVSSQSTILLSSTGNPLGEAPPGNGYVLLTNHLGNLILTGALPDGSTFSQYVPLGKLADVPIFANLYGNTGLLLGLIRLTNGMPQGEGNLIWIKPARPGIYPDGFTNALSVQGSPWVAAAPLPVFTGTLTISNASLDLTYQISMIDKSVAETSGATNPLHGTLNPNTGVMTLIFGNGAGKATTTGYAALLYDTFTAGGYFVTKTNAGSISLGQPTVVVTPLSINQPAGPQ